MKKLLAMRVDGLPIYSTVIFLVCGSAWLFQGAHMAFGRDFFELFPLGIVFVLLGLNQLRDMMKEVSKRLSDRTIRN